MQTEVRQRGAWAHACEQTQTNADKRWQTQSMAYPAIKSAKISEIDSSKYLYRANGRGGFGSQTAADPPSPPTPGNLWKADYGYCDSISQNANPASTFGHCEERLLESRPHPYTSCSKYLSGSAIAWACTKGYCKRGSGGQRKVEKIRATFGTLKISKNLYITLIYSKKL